jgi:2-hydroxy-6-oxonona-2,4-dienedioate hydrolase
VDIGLENRFTTYIVITSSLRIKQPLTTLILAVIFGRCGTCLFNILIYQFHSENYTVRRVGKLKTKYAIIDNLRIRYQDSATAGVKTLILLHGLGGSIDSWDSNTGQLSKKYRTVVFDLPGFGLSDKPLKNYTIGFFSSFVMKAVRILNIEIPIKIIGSSLGGQIAANIAIVNPNEVDKLVLISPAGFTPKSFLNSRGLQNYTSILGATSEAEIKKALSETTTAFVSSKLATLVRERILLPGAKDAFDSSLRHSATARRININKIKSPTLVIWGKEDLVIPVRFVFPFIEMKNCRVNVLENCGHRPHAEQPALVNEIIQRFIRGN